MNISDLLPPIPGLYLKEIIHQTTSLRVCITCTYPIALCPICGQSSTRIHSGYTRKLGDLPWSDKPVSLEVAVRRFRCEQEPCPRKIFAERLHPSIAAYARRTTRLEERLRHLGQALGGEGVVRISKALALPSVSGDTMLRIIRKTPTPVPSTYKIIGIDEWAFHKGRKYGTILVDLEKKQPIDLLPDDKVETVVNWLQHHPELEVVSRDRDTAFAEAIRKGAPQAIQVADRWHLVNNLAVALTQIVDKDKSALQAVARHQKEKKQQEEAHQKVQKEEQQQAQKPKTKAELFYDQVRGMHQEGWSIRKIAIQLNMSRNTIRHYLRNDHIPFKKINTGAGHSRNSLNLQQWQYLVQRRQEGQTNGRQLFRELREQGYQGSVDSVYRAVRKLPAAPINPILEEQKNALPPLASKKAVALLLKDTKELKEQDQLLLEDLLVTHQLAGKVYPLIQGFKQLMKDKQADGLQAWISAAKASEIGPLTRFAAGLERDFEAVYHGFALSWSNGQVEGQINRLKLLKRQMYGRANLDLLKKRVLYHISTTTN